ncbi:hypothetical protein EV126DRAFT_210338 [Verticillium dahliae]|nr:hypothetical protein EV126DRAFT_210338 [Verticillium dahliae]
MCLVHSGNGVRWSLRIRYLQTCFGPVLLSGASLNSPTASAADSVAHCTGPPSESGSLPQSPAPYQRRPASLTYCCPPDHARMRVNFSHPRSYQLPSCPFFSPPGKKNTSLRLRRCVPCPGPDVPLIVVASHAHIRTHTPAPTLVFSPAAAAAAVAAAATSTTTLTGLPEPRLCAEFHLIFRKAARLSRPGLALSP